MMPEPTTVWAWFPIAFGYITADESHAPGSRVHLNGTTVPNEHTGLVPPMPDLVGVITSIVPENRDTKSALHGRPCVKHAKALIDERDRARCTNEVPESAVSLEDRMMVALMEAEGQPSTQQKILEGAANAMTTAAGKDMGARLLTQARLRKLPEAKADSLTKNLELEGALQAIEVERACAEVNITPTADELAGYYAWVRLDKAADPKKYFDQHPKFTRWAIDKDTPGRYLALAAKTSSIPPVVITR